MKKLIKVLMVVFSLLFLTSFCGCSGCAKAVSDKIYTPEDQAFISQLSDSLMRPLRYEELDYYDWSMPDRKEEEDNKQVTDSLFTNSETFYLKELQALDSNNTDKSPDLSGLFSVKPSLKGEHSIVKTENSTLIASVTCVIIGIIVLILVFIRKKQ
jgi:hypothetical protein